MNASCRVRLSFFFFFGSAHVVSEQGNPALIRAILAGRCPNNLEKDLSNLVVFDPHPGPPGSTLNRASPFSAHALPFWTHGSNPVLWDALVSAIEPCRLP